MKCAVGLPCPLAAGWLQPMVGPGRKLGERGEAGWDIQSLNSICWVPVR